MPLVDTGRNFLAAAMIGEAGHAPYNNTNAHIAVGDSNAAFSAAQTDLQGSNIRKPMQLGYPVRVTNKNTFRSMFETSEANFAWEEWGLFNAPVGGTLFNRKIENLGTKTDAQTWLLTVDVEIQS